MDIDDLTILLSKLSLYAPVCSSISHNMNGMSLRYQKKVPASKPQNDLRRIPPEIRVMIFECVLCIAPFSTMILYNTRRLRPRPSQAGPPSTPIRAPPSFTLLSTPNLLAALRPTPDLYGEALEVFYAINRFSLDITSFRRFMQLRVAAVKLIRFLEIDTKSVCNA